MTLPTADRTGCLICVAGDPDGDGMPDLGQCQSVYFGPGSFADPYCAVAGSISVLRFV
jgi:hypothetical protein